MIVFMIVLVQCRLNIHLSNPEIIFEWQSLQKRKLFLEDKLPITHRYVHFCQVLRRGLYICEVVYLFYFNNTVIAVMWQ